MLEQSAELLLRSGDIVDWIEKNYYIPETNGPIELVPYQKAMLREATRRDADGLLVYSTVLWCDIKKSAKSSIAAAVALWRASTTPWGSVKIVANDLKQADSRVNRYMQRSIQLNPNLIGITKRGNLTRFPNGALVEAVPIDPGGEAGGTDHLIVFSELWAARHKAFQQMWTEMTLSPTLYGNSQRWIETYAGYVGQSPILERLHAQIEDGTPLDLSFTDDDGHHDLSDLNVCANGRTLIMWNDTPRCPWQTPAYYAQERQDLEPSEFLRVHRNQWQSSTEAFLPIEWWDACKVRAIDTLARDRLTMAVDAGVSDDAFAVVLVHNRGQKSRVVYCKVWTAKRGQKIDYDGPRAEILRLLSAYTVREVRYDEYQLHDMMSRIQQTHRRTVFTPFGQGKKRLMADKQLYDRIKNGYIEHTGEPVLRQHLMNADAAKTGDNKLRIVKRTPAGKIDAAVALSMAVFDEDGLDRIGAESLTGLGVLENYDNPWG